MDTWLIVGLGNPGAKYAGNRHNIGFMVLDKMAEEEPAFGPFRSKFQSQMSEARLGAQKVVLLKPQTYMNNSGQAVAAAAKFYKIPPEKIVVFHDELDLGPGENRIKQGGGNAGHNGLKSIQAHLGTPNFWRVRMGISRPPHKGQVTSYVLNDFAKADHDWLSVVLDNSARNFDLLLKGDMKDYEKKLREGMKSSSQPFEGK